MEDRRVCIKFCVKNGFKGAEIFWMLQTGYGDAVMSRRRVFEWYKRFKEGQEETADNERSERPSTSTTPEKVDKMLELVREDRRITVREVAEEAGVSFGSTQSIMKNILGVRRLNAVLVPKDLTFDQKNTRKETASLNLEATTDDPELLKRVITGDETWIYDFDSETTQQASEWRFKNEPRPKKARKAHSKVKVMLTVFFDYQGIVHHEFQQQGSTITADSYLGVLRRLREAIRQKWPELWRSKSWIPHHDNAPAHTALKISKFLQDHSTSVFPQPPYSPDLAPATFTFLESSKKVIGSEISEHRRDQSGIEEGHEGDPENRLPEVFCRLEKKKVAEMVSSIQSLKNEISQDIIPEADLDLMKTCNHVEAQKLVPGFHRRVKAKTSFQDNDVPIEEKTTKNAKLLGRKFQDFDGILGRTTSDPFEKDTERKKMAENPNNRLQKFNGSKSAIRPESWIKLYDFENNSLKEDEKIKNLMYYLTDSALEWYADEIISNPAIKRWEVVKEKLIQRFGSYNANPIVSASHRRLKREESIENYFQDKIRLLNQTHLTKEEKIHLLTDGLPNDWKDLIVAAQPTDTTKWFHIAASIEQNRASIQFKPKNKIHLATKNNDNRKNVCPFWCPICSKNGIKIKHWVTDCEDYDPNYKKDRPNQNTSVKQVCGAPELLNVSTLTNTPTQGAFKLINISVEVNGIPAQAFVDTGATVSIINWRLFKRTRLQLQPNSDIHISQADGVTRTCGSLQTKVRIDKLIKPVTLHVMKNFKYPLLIGLDVASLFNLLIDVRDKTIYTKFYGLQNPILVNHLEEIREHELKELLEHNRNVFSQHAIDLGKVAIQHKIITKSEQPISLRPYRRPLKEYEEIAEQVKELLEHKLIRTSDSPWAFPVVMVPKKDGNKRMCIDYRRLNGITLDDRQPLPHIQDMFDRLHGSRFFSTLDVAWGYWQIEMDPQSIQDFPRPDTVKKVRQFMGLANYYRKFVKDFSKISFPLVRLTRKNQPFIWNEEVEESFAKLKMALSTKPVLAIYNPDYPSKVYTDASKYGIGAILTQIGPDNEEHVIAYYSKTLQPHQENYSAYEMECLAVIQATDHFHVYIENQPFEIITDHAALQWLFTMKKPKPKYFRWILSLSSKSCNIVHRSGKQQTHVDALSRLPVVNIATQELQEHQQNSDLSFLKNSHTHDGVVMIKQKGVFKAVVPNSLTKKILEEYHDSLSHPSITKTCKLITQCYWWKGITTDIKNYVRSCKSCQLVKVRHEPTLGEMITPTSNIQPLQMIGCDTIVLGTAAANTKHKFIQVFVDHATRYLWAYPTITNTAQAVTQCLDKIIKSVNSINTILTDNGKNFISKEFNKFLSLQGIKHTYTSPYHPQCNGICEKLNDTIMTKLRIAVLEKPRCKWSSLLPQVVKNYNSTPHDVTGFSPLFLMYGIGNVPEFADQTPITIEEARKKASLRTEQIRSKWKIKHDSHHPKYVFKEGDLVIRKIAFNDPRLIKTSPKYEGPFVIQKKISDVTYDISLKDQKQARRVHISQLRPFITRE
ncbi:K02A2.6-like [Cordylochernes scorpioides]|uniref:RNA-directed DNA polymerase n=1 Tax=Cordylochernes scorpioides TaxID=51811 RepID=A0ABY6JYI0_9ARAC|nr:K02A2.6-like [Cordylochernes scorpioides]